MQRLTDRTGSSALELTGLLALVSVLLAAAAPLMQRSAPTVTDSISRTLAESVRGERAHIRRFGDVPRRSIRPGLPSRTGPQVALHRYEARGSAGTVQACLFCAEIEASTAFGLGPNVGRRRTGTIAGTGLHLLGQVRATAAVAQARVQHRVRLDAGAATLVLDSEARAVVGVEGEGRAELAVDHRRQQLHLELHGIAGARARASHRAGLKFLGIALEGSGAVEGWAGAGATGLLDIDRGPGTMSVRTRLGGALGLGGAYELGGSIDASAVGTGSAQGAVRRRALSMIPALALSSWVIEQLQPEESQ